MDVRFELTTNDPWPVDDAICEGISPLGYWQKVNQSRTQTKPYNTIRQIYKYRSTISHLYHLRIAYCIDPQFT